MIDTKAVRVIVLDDARRVEAIRVLSTFRTNFYRCLTSRADALFEVTDALLDAVRLGPADDVAAVTAEQLRQVTERLIAAGHHTFGDPRILIVCDAGYDIPRLAFLLADLPVDLLGRLRSDRVMALPPPQRLPGATGRPPKHGA